MKKSIKILSVSILMAGSVLTSCSTPAEKVEDAKEKVEDANEELEEEQVYFQDVEDYKKQTAMEISNNEKSIAEFNERIASQKLEAREAYTKKITELDGKNSDMKKKLDDFKADNKAAWEKFKSEFNHEMKELGDAFRDFEINNKK